MKQNSEFVKSFLQKSSNESDRRYYNRIYFKEPVIRPRPYVLKENEIILGCRTPTFTRANTTTLDCKKFNDDGTPNAVSFLIIGRQGTGKSITGASVGLDNLVYRFGEKIFIYDPKNEFDKHTEPSFENGVIRKAKVDEYLSSINLARKGYKLVSIAPEIAGRHVKVDHRFSITFDDILEIYNFDKTEAIKILIELLGIASEGAIMDLVREILSSKKIRSFDELRTESLKVAKKLSLPPQTQAVFARKIKVAVSMGILSKGEGKGIDILNLMKDNDGVIYKAKLKLTGSDSEADLAYNAILKLVCLKLVIDCFLYVQGSAAAVVRSKNGVCFMFDEIDVLASEIADSSTRTFITNMLTKYRAAKIDFIGIGQEASLIYHELFSQCKVIITSQVTSNNAKMLKDRHISKELVDATSGLLGQLKLKEKTSVDTYVSEWCCIDENNQIVGPYWPMPPLSNFN